MAALFSEQDVAREFAGKVAASGRAYQAQKRVRDLEIDDDGALISAKVVGGAPRPYRVEVAIMPPLDNDVDLAFVMFDTECTCPMGFDCKHAAAVLFEVLAVSRKLQPASSVRIAPPPSDPLAGPVADWLGQLAATGAGPSGDDVIEQVVFILDLKPFGYGHVAAVAASVVRRLKSGGYGQPRPVNFSSLASSTALYAKQEDRLIARLLTLEPWRGVTQASLPGDPALADVVLRRLLQTGRCHWKSKDTPALALGEPRVGEVKWRLLADARQVPFVDFGTPDVVAFGEPAGWYVDISSSVVGPLDLGLPAPMAAALLQAPPVAPTQVRALRAALARTLPDHNVAAPADDVIEEVVSDPPVPYLRLASVTLQSNQMYYRNAATVTHDILQLSYDYGGTIVEAGSAPREIRSVDGRRALIRKRDDAAEEAALRKLYALGFEDHGGIIPKSFVVGRQTLVLAKSDDWPSFVHQDLPDLIKAGWRVEFDDSFRHRVVEADGEWQAEVTDEGDGGWWFSLDLGIDIAGKRESLLPLLVQALKTLREGGTDIAGLSDGDTLYGRLDDGRKVALPVERVRTLLSVLIELFDTGALTPAGRLDLSLAQAVGLAEVEAAIGLRWLGGERLRRLAARLAEFDGVASVAPPEGFAAELRPYQQQGLDWMQFLRDYELGGILADDMGLGKTVQALAHILTEKRSGRLDRPCLVVCPTSLVPNWKSEAARFAPDLKVVSLQGPDRHQRFADLAGTDLALTTFPLLGRDEEALLAQDWHLVILDEAQAIKNPAAKATLVACRLKARHRLCLTGTPVENHLGELWSQFAFLMPGLLGDTRLFGRLFRTPIEKQGNKDRQALLARRLRPFILRRTKAAVAAELPAKTLITRKIELAGDQRDLYETVRLSMHDKVRRAVAEKGLARSHIIILDALLKLRQVCCDPRLVKLTAARRAGSSSKLSHLMEMLPELIEDGRRILLFSQFTGMLDLIEAEVDTLKIPYVDLRGDTLDRATPVARFQRGEVPLFCLSLKAGGTGLNLTAADTVIHYDPWWNPAAEAQATDRAHRIGQDKPVFVYKLIAEGTIEERMLELQVRKATLANGLFDPDQGNGGFEATDLDLLFHPLACT